MCASGQMPYGAVIGQSPRHRLLPFSPQPKTEFEVKIRDLDTGVAALLG